MTLWLLWTFLLHWGRAVDIATPARLHDEEAIRQAVNLLQTAGVTDLCSPSRRDLGPYFSYCGEFHATEQSSPPPDQSLRHKNRNLQDQDDDTYNDYDDSTRMSHSKLEYLVDCIGTAVCVVGAALASGLTIGLLSLDPVVLLMKSRAASDEAERQQAESLLPLIQQRHLLLVSLLLMNTGKFTEKVLL